MSRANEKHAAELADDGDESVRASSEAGSETLELRRQDALYLRSEKLLASPPPMALMARDLSAFFRISTAVGEIRRLKPLKRRLLELIGEVVPFRSGAVVLVGEDADEMDSATGWLRGSERDETVQLDRPVLERALRRSESILTRADSDSQHSRSILCIPLLLDERVLGAVFMESGADGLPFTEDHLQFLTSVSGVIAVSLENVRNIEWLERENRRLSGSQLKHGLVGKSPAMQTAFQFIAKVAPSDSTVLLLGESGTGKELIARAIHLNSPRAARPFLAINCATLTEALLESELFGHEKGAFTGAVRSKKGKLELADGGTVFLDELADLALGLQAKLLRVLQESEFERVGGTRPIRVDIRLVAATNRNLEEAMRNGAFREDLYYRLNVVSYTAPPLRERPDDIPMLAKHFINKHGGKSNRRILGVSPSVVELLLNYSWPGNVRELENALERAVVMGTEEFIQPEDLPHHILDTGRDQSGYSVRYHEAVRQFKKDVIRTALKRSGGQFVKAAKRLGVHPNYLHRLVTQLGLRQDI